MFKNNDLILPGWAFEEMGIVTDVFISWIDSANLFEVADKLKCVSTFNALPFVVVRVAL